MSRYRIGDGIFAPSIEVEINGFPPCLWCNTPITPENGPSMDGPLVCMHCDCGRNKDGSRWTEEEYKKHAANFSSRVAKYRAIAKARAEKKCRICGEPNDDGEGWNGLCGNCADKADP